MSIHETPKRPGISRFVAPWDTSGWYYMAANFAEGCRIYSNASITVTECPAFLRGCDYIVTYDSATDGFDDKQEVDFFIERAGEVYAALDEAAPTDFLTGFTRTSAVIRTDAGDTYHLFMRPYAAGAHVHLDGFASAGRHFFAVFRPTGEDAERPLPEAKRVAVQAVHETHETSWHVHDCFAQETVGSAPKGYSCRGDVQVCIWEDAPKRRYVRLQRGGRLARICRTNGQDELSMALDVPQGMATLCFAGVTVVLGNAQASINGQVVPEIEDSRFVVSLKRYWSPQRCEVWMNNRPACVCPCDAAEETTFTLQASEVGEVRLDRLDWKDQTDVPLLEENFTAMPSGLLPETRASITSQCGIGSFLRGASCGMTFPAVSREAMVEITCRANGEEAAVFPELRDASGRTIMKAALIANSLYLSDGASWHRVCGGYAPWQYFPAGNWYRLTVSLDFAAHTFDVDVDGARRAKRFRMACDAENVAQVLLTAMDGTADWRCLRVWDTASLHRNMLPAGERFDVCEYGAKGDGTTNDTQAIQRALDAAEGSGGVVVIPEGVYLTKQVQLRSDTMLWLDKDAVLLASQAYSTYPHVVPCESLVAVRNTGRALVYAERVRNIAISGGELNANGRCRFKVNDPKGINKLYTSRPDNLYMACCEDVRVSDVRFTNAAYWTLVPLSSRFVTLEHLMLDCMNTPNRDGIDPVDCHDLNVRHCCIMAGDDGFCLKTADRMGCRNIFAEDLVIQSLASAIKIGTDSYALVENVTVRRCILKNVNRCGIAVESVDGAAVRHLTFEDIDMTDCGGPMYMTIGHRGRKAPQFPARTGSMAHVVFRRIGYRTPYPFSRCKTVYESLFIGDSAENRICDVLVTDCDLLLPGGCGHGAEPPQPIGEKYPEYDRHGLSSGAAFALRFCEDVRFENCVIGTEKPDVRPLVMMHDC